MNEFVIVRHGNTFDSGDTLLRVGARTDLPLSKSGQAQAMALGDHFVDKFPDGFSQATSSPLLRTRQTAEAILSVYDSPPLLRTEAFLTEVDYGPDEGQAEEKVVARLGPDALALWESSAVPPADWLVDTAQLRKDWRTFFATTNDNGEPSRTLV
ncbi:MAG: phosphoglycerate mutase family protein [Pseudomonadota bacterium]